MPQGNEKSADPRVRPRGIRIISNLDVFARGQSTRDVYAASREDLLFGAQAEQLGTIDTFGLGGFSESNTHVHIEIPVNLGPSALLVHDVLSGQWQWQFAGQSGEVQAFHFDVAAVETTGGAPGGAIGAAPRLTVRVVNFVGLDRVAKEAGHWSLDAWERINRRSAIVQFSQLVSPTTVEPTDLRSLANGRSLLLLHDVFATTASTFCQMPMEYRRKLNELYSNRVWGYDHATLTLTPRRNAERLIELLQQRNLEAQVDILAVGRGGLVALELVEQRSEWLGVGTVALVGVPLGGNPLCSADRIRSFANRHTNLLSMFPDNPFTTTLDAVCAMITQVATGVMSGLEGVTSMSRGCNSTFPAGPSYAMIVGNAVRGDQHPWSERLRDAAVDDVLGDKHDGIVAADKAANSQMGAVTNLEGLFHRQLISAGTSCRQIIQIFSGATKKAAAGTAPLPTPTPAPALIRDGAPVDPVRRYQAVERAQSGATLAKTHVSVVHGNVVLEPATVLVGHFLGTGLTGAEWAIDTRTRGRLSLRHLARLYPEKIGESEILPNTIGDGGTGFPARAIVVGLGVPGSLTRTGLTNTVTAGLLRLAIAEGERPRTPSRGKDSNVDEVQVIDLSALLVGRTGLAALDIESSVAAIVDGVLATNSRLRSLVNSTGQTLIERVRFGDICFVELQEDVAEIAARAVKRIRDLVRVNWQPFTDLTNADKVRHGEGGWPRRLAYADDPDWQRVVVGQDRDQTDDVGAGSGVDSDGGATSRPTITFTVIGQSASTGQETVRPNVGALKSLLADIVESGDGSKGATLFRLLVPRNLRSAVGSADNLHLIVDQYTACYPWEALIYGEDGADTEAISRRAGFIRQFIDTEGTRDRPQIGDTRSALVIGNPPSHLRDLPGATDEAKQIKERLDRNGYTTTMPIWREPIFVVPPPGVPATVPQPMDESATILHELSSGRYRILHIAGHGVQTKGNRDETGVVIGPHSYLTADDIHNQSNIPEMVFLNCCNLGANPGLAANLARAFMRSGAQVVIAAGWPVGDAVATRFADRFYQEMLDGSTFGAAVTMARRVAYAGATDLTWAAYQCYGDPGYRIEARTASGVGVPSMVSGAEFLRSVEIIRVKAADIGRLRDEPQIIGRERLLQRLRSLCASQVELTNRKSKSRSDNDDNDDDEADRTQLSSWMNARSLAAIAETAAELGDFEMAGDYFNLAVSENNAQAPVAAVEQRGQFEIRRALQVLRSGDRDCANELAAAAEEHLNQAMQLGRTKERLCLMGSFWKKRAAMIALQAGDDTTQHDTIHEHVKKAANFYREAMEKDPDDAYPVLVWIQLTKLSTGHNPDPDRAAMNRAMKASSSLEGDFWQRAAIGDKMLTLLVTSPAEVIEDVVTNYCTAFELRSSWRERSSVLDHIRDLIALAEGTKREKLETLLDALITTIHERLGQDE